MTPAFVRVLWREAETVKAENFCCADRKLSRWRKEEPHSNFNRIFVFNGLTSVPNWTDRPSEVRPVVGACACGCQVTTAGDECAALGGGGVVVGEDGLDVDRRVDSDR